MPTQVEDLKLANGAGRIELFDVDIAALGGPIYRLTPQPAGDLGYVLFGAQQYSHFPLEFTGAAVSTEGSMPRATLAVGAVSNIIFKQALLAYGSLLGTKITRRVTYAKYLDNGTSPNSTFHSVPETWYISKVIEWTKDQIRFECSLPVDAPNIVFPPGQLLKVQSGNPWDIWAPGMTRI